MAIPTPGDDHPAQAPRMKLLTSMASRTGRGIPAIVAAAFLGVLAGARGAQSSGGPSPCLRLVAGP